LIFELSDISEWKPQVMDSQIPVVLDCYADWCGPCKKLMPILVEKIKEYNGLAGGSTDEDETDPENIKIRLVKLNIDNIPQLSQAL